MDNKDNNINDESQIPVNTEVDEESSEPNLTEQPEKKKSGQGLAVFSLLLALLALLISGWTFYRIGIQSDNDSSLAQQPEMATQQDLQKLQKQIKDLEQDFNQQANSTQKIQQQLNRLQQDLSSLPSNEFDATGLEQQINLLQQQFNMLKSQYRDQPNEPQTEEHLSAMVRAQTVSALRTVQLLITQQQIPEAINVLKNWRNNKYLPLVIQTRLQQLVTTLSNLETPNLDALRLQLASVNKEITALSLITERPENEQSAWYESFITVKKIKPEQHNLNSVDLQQIKANASHSIQQAELGLTLKQPSVWSNSLKQAKKSLSETSLNTGDIAQELQRLSEQNILTQIPKDLGIDVLIQQLEGISE